MYGSQCVHVWVEEKGKIIVSVIVSDPIFVHATCYALMPHDQTRSYNNIYMSYITCAVQLMCMHTFLCQLLFYYILFVHVLSTCSDCLEYLRLIVSHFPIIINIFIFYNYSTVPIN